MFGRWLTSAKDTAPIEGAEQLESVVRGILPNADPETARVVTAIAGVLGAVAYADRNYSAEEENLVREMLARIEGMTPAGVDAISTVLRKHIIEVATVQTPRYCRALRELGDRELRVEVLQLLVDVTAADGKISHDESNVVRRLTAALGLTQDDYNDAQAKHRERLSVIKADS
jgi:uncharacterized tellurite resistance protein B-like protein